MSDKPILFSAPMVRALLDGRKSQTRRVLKPQPSAECQGFQRVFKQPPFFEALGHAGKPIYAFPDGNHFVSPYPKISFDIGDRLWVRETFFDSGPFAKAPLFSARENPIMYRADEDFIGCHKWKPSIFMPRSASRLTLTVTDVRVERLQDISEADAIAEGVELLFSAEEIARHPECAGAHGFQNYLWHGHIGRTITGKQSDAWGHQYSSYQNARGSYSSLWEMINGPGAWEANPWVVAISFDVHCCNIDKMEVPA